MNHILLLDKPKGISSHDCVYAARRNLGIKKIGHGGTLDPLATGLLVLAVGDATRFLRYLQMEPKHYSTSIRLGIETNTYDAEGTVVSVRDASGTSIAELQRVAARFVGEIEQLPPMFSAVKVGGQPLYKRARCGEEVVRSTRTVTVHQFDILSYENQIATASIVCSTGTYVRSLVHDLGIELGTGAHVTELRRIAVGSFSVTSAVPLEDISVDVLIPLAEALAPMPIERVSGSEKQRLLTGQQIARGGINAPLIGLVDEAGEFLAIAHSEGQDVWQPECVIPLVE